MVGGNIMACMLVHFWRMSSWCNPSEACYDGLQILDFLRVCADSAC